MAATVYSRISPHGFATRYQVGIPSGQTSHVLGPPWTAQILDPRKIGGGTLYLVGDGHPQQGSDWNAPFLVRSSLNGSFLDFPTSFFSTLPDLSFPPSPQ